MSDSVRDLPLLLAAAGVRLQGSIPLVPVTQVTDDSRRVRRGALFLAMRGTKTDGHRFVQEAIQRGVGSVLLEEDIALPAGIVKLRVPSTRAIFGPIAHVFYGSPSCRLRMVGVTGTKGKTTVAWLIQHLLETAGISCGLLGTVGNRWAGRMHASDNTTPGVVVLQETLSQMVHLGIQACVMEVSSHALDQQRTGGIQWACAVFTNLAPEHLDYHKTMEGYLHSKMRLFEVLPPEAKALVNQEDAASSRIRSAVKGESFSYGFQPDADFRAEAVRLSLEGVSFSLKTSGREYAVASKLVGLHNVENLLAALGAVAALGVPLEQILSAVAAFEGVPGRMERIECGQPFPVFVDYAHTEDSLRRVLESLRQVTDRKILTVFGCGGDRDRSKRPRMGRVAAELSDRVIVTSDNSRSEDPRQIAEEITGGMEGMLVSHQIILDRREAIRTAFEQVDRHGVVLIAGKGHESRQIFADKIIPFDDRAVARELLGVRRVADCQV